MIRMNKNLVSIVVPVYNAAEHIERCVESVIDQSYDNWELILVNDGSTDDSLVDVTLYSKEINESLL